MKSNLELSKFWCWQKDCSDYGKTGIGNIVLKERYGKDNRALLKCRTCGHCFSETHGTPFFGLNTPIDEVCRTLSLIPEKGAFAELRGFQDMIRDNMQVGRSCR